MYIRLFFVLAFSLIQGAIHAKPVVLITGASRGIGFSIAEELAKNAYPVYAGVRKSSSKELLSIGLKNYPDYFHVIELDVTDQSSIDRAVDSIMREEGRIDVLVNNAGVEAYGSIENLTIEEAQKVFDVNFFGMMRVTQVILPIMRSQNGGRIIQISSRSGFRPLPVLSIYAASKFALEGLSETIAALCKPWNIFVSLIEPGPVDTDLDYEAPYGSRLPRENDPYFAMFERAGLLEPYSPLAQSPNEIASLVKDVIEAENPHFRYQTAEYIKKQAALRFVDITGDSSISEWEKMFR